MNYLDILLSKLKSIAGIDDKKEMIPDSTKETEKSVSVENNPVKADVSLENTEEKAKSSEISATQKSRPKTNAVDYESIFNKIIEDSGYDKYVSVGTTDLICPSCKAALKEFPEKTTKCPSCKSYIYLRVRSSNSKKVILNKEQLDEFEMQEKVSSGKYRKMTDMTIHNLNQYASSGIEGWIFMSPLDKADKPEFVKMHGNVIKAGSDEELKAIKLLCRPDCRAKTSAWYDNPKLDTDPGEYEIQRNSWLEQHNSDKL